MQKVMKNNRHSVFRIFLILTSGLLFLSLFPSCSENPPEIEQLFWQSNRYYDLDKRAVYNTLSVFIQVSDQDGIEDIASLYIINDKEELFWKINNENLVIKENRGAVWAGSSRIKMNDYSLFPTGEYRVLVIDEAGEREETSFIFKNSSYMPDKEQFPLLSITGNNVRTGGGADVLWIYDENGSLITENYTEGNKQVFPLMENAYELFVYRYDRINGTGLITGPYAVKQE